MKTLRHLWTHHRIALSAFVLATLAAGYFAVTTIAATIYWMDPAHQNQPLADWMTPRYVAQSYKLPRPVIEEVFMLERGVDPPRIRLRDIMAEHDMSMADLQNRLDAAVADRATQQEATSDE